jgi:hypothetical protein
VEQAYADIDAIYRALLEAERIDLSKPLVSTAGGCHYWANRSAT